MPHTHTFRLAVAHDLVDQTCGQMRDRDMGLQDGERVKNLVPEWCAETVSCCQS